MGANKSLNKFRSPVTTAVAALLLSGAAQADTVSWLGSNGSWQDAWHWTNFGRPGANDDVSLAWPYAMGATAYLSKGYSSSYGPAQIGSLTIGASNRVQIWAETLQVSGAIVNDGELLLDTSNGVPSSLKIGTDTTLAGTGTLTLKYGGLLDLNARTLTIGSAQTVHGTGGDIGNGNLINQGHLMADGVLSFYPGAGSVDNSAGRISVGAQGILSANQASFTGGRITTASGGAIYGSGGAASATFSKLTFEGDARFGGAMTLVDAANKGTLSINGTAAVTSVKGALVNDGSIYVEKTLAIQGDTRLTGSGTVWLRRDSGPFQTFIGFLDVAANSTLTIDSTQTVRGAGRIRGSANSRIVNQGSLIAEGGTLSLFAGDGILDNSAGHITVAHDAVIGSNGTLILGDASTLAFDVGSSAADHGALYIMSSAPQALDGTLRLNIGYGAKVGDSFTLLSYIGGETGTFDQVIATGYTLTTSYSASDMTVTISGITAVPEPASWLLAGAGLVVVGRRVRKQA